MKMRHSPPKVIHGTAANQKHNIDLKKIKMRLISHIRYRNRQSRDRERVRKMRDRQTDSRGTAAWMDGWMDG